MKKLPILPSFVSRPLMTAAAIASATVSAHAQNTWVPAGAGAWGTTTNWSLGTVPVAADDVVFGNTVAGTVTLGASRPAATLALNITGATVFNTGSGPHAITVTGGTTINNSALVTIGSATAASNVTLSTATLTKEGSGEVVLYGANTIGNVLVNAGTLSLRNATAAGSSATPITLGASSGSASAALRAVSLTVANPVVLGGTTGPLVINNLGGGTNAIYTGGVTGTNNLGIQSVLSSAGSSTTINTGALAFTGALTLANTGTASVNNLAGTVTISAAIADTVTHVTVSNLTTVNAGITRGTQTVVFGGSTAKSYTGTTTIGALAALTLSGTSTIPSTTAININGGNFLVSSTASNRINDSAPVTLGGSGTSSLTLSGTIVETLGTLNAASGGTNVVNFGTTAGTLNFAGSSSTLWTGNLQVWNWTGGTDHLFFGSSDSGLLASQAAGIEFFSGDGTGSLGTGTILPSGEVVPVPEPVLPALLGSLGVLALLHRRRSC